MAKRIGLTGNIGSGKSTAARHFRELGAAVIDADALAREATGEEELILRIAEELGEELVTDGRLDRPRLARLVFADAGARRKLEGIIHPWVRERSRTIESRLLASSEPPPAIVHDLPLLFENRLQGSFDAVVVVSAPLHERAARVAARSGLSEEEVRARDAAQLPLAEKEARADFVLDNSGAAGELAAQVKSVWRRLVGE